MIVPKKWLNGTATVDLAEDAKITLAFLRNGLKALREMWPNGRDYVYDAPMLALAQIEFAGIIERQEAIIKEIEAYLGGVMDR